MSEFPFLTGVVPTYNRFPADGWLLEETVECFRRQTWRLRELLILNDTPGQTLTCDVPGVRIVNLPYRCRSFGAKRNLMVSMARGDVYVVADDDDLFLPHRFQQAVEHLDGRHGYFNPHRLFYWEKGKPPAVDHGGVCHQASAHTKWAWERGGRYDEALGAAEDADFDKKMRQHGWAAPPLRDDEMPSTVYRWGVSPTHLSGSGNLVTAWGEIGSRPVVPGTFKIEPHWRQDYEAICRKAWDEWRAQ